VRKFLGFALVLILLAILWLGNALFNPYGPSQQKFVALRPGSSTRAVARTLQQEGVIRNYYAFLLLSLFEGRRSLKAGEYAFEHPANAFEIYDRLIRGDVYVRVVPIPEGYNMFDIAQALDAAHICSKQDFLAVAKDPSLVRDLDPQAPSLEGYLFPDTYRLGRTENPREIALEMVKRFRKEAAAIGLTHDLHRVVTMASIVEKETAVKSERPLVAGVFENRMTKRIGLATDPSVIYAALLAGRYNGVIHQSDLAFNSPYNTYRYGGLPPGPIANPGRESLLAAMHPQRTDFLYFVANNQGGHNFAKTLDEHNRNVAVYRRGLAQH
jgi:peptidoglycan lytic transglycosylase G